MDTSPEPLDRETFAQWVHEALRRLYDSVALQANPLVELFAREADGAFAQSQQFRRVLLDAIRSLRPAPGTPADSRDWRSYRLLELRFIEGLTPEETMEQLALGRSQFFRDQAQIVDTLISELWSRWQATLSDEKQPSAEDPARDALIRSEVSRLGVEAATGIEPATLFAELRPLVQPLASARGVAVCFRPTTFDPLPADRVLARQATLSAITLALEHPQIKHLDISTATGNGWISIQVRAWPVCGEEGPDQPMRSSDARIRGCRELLAAARGVLETGYQGQHWVALLKWPMAPSHQLLVVDDNQGLVDLFRRYLVGTRWQVAGAANTREARDLIANTRPVAIVLDLLIPKEDGWEFLLSLRNDPATRDIPVIICSVLEQPALALSLGATAYLPKPVTQQDLLRVLKPWNG